jgi:histidine triad (HIT) family protein
MLRDENCIFCKILDGVIPSVKIREDDDFLAILDAFPNRRGMTLVITKDHMDSDILAKDDDFIAKYFQAAKKVADMLKK